MNIMFDWMHGKLTCPNVSQHRGFKLIEQIAPNIFECQCGEIFCLDENGKPIKGNFDKEEQE